MQERLDHSKLAPEAYKLLTQLTMAAKSEALGTRLLELCKTRASQINGCAYCIQMHVQFAKKAGETDERLHLLAGWREAPHFSSRERAALAWTEAVTLVADGHVPDDVYQQALGQFSEKDLVDLTYALATINAWNRLSVAFRKMPGLPAN